MYLRQLSLSALLASSAWRTWSAGGFPTASPFQPSELACRTATRETVCQPWPRAKHGAQTVGRLQRTGADSICIDCKLGGSQAGPRLRFWLSNLLDPHTKLPPPPPQALLLRGGVRRAFPKLEDVAGPCTGFSDFEAVSDVVYLCKADPVVCTNLSRRPVPVDGYIDQLIRLVGRTVSGLVIDMEPAEVLLLPEGSFEVSTEFLPADGDHSSVFAAGEISEMSRPADKRPCKDPQGPVDVSELGSWAYSCSHSEVTDCEESDAGDPEPSQKPNTVISAGDEGKPTATDTLFASSTADSEVCQTLRPESKSSSFTRPYLSLLCLILTVYYG